MPRRIAIALILALVATTGLLSIRLYKTSRQLDKAEGLMLTATHLWISVCVTAAAQLVGNPQKAQAGLDLLHHCVSDTDLNEVEALYNRGQRREADGLARRRVLFERRFPRHVERGPNEGTSYPAGYPD
jgi:hypothetical protein